MITDGWDFLLGTGQTEKKTKEQPAEHCLGKLHEYLGANGCSPVKRPWLTRLKGLSQSGGVLWDRSLRKVNPELRFQKEDHCLH